MPVVINHIALNCKSVPAQEAFYIKHFGFKRSRTFQRGEVTEFIMLKLGDMRLELFPTPNLAHLENGGEQTIGFKHLAFQVHSLQPYLASLTADGVKPNKVIDIPSIPGLKIVFLLDPEGNVLELMENYEDEIL